MSSSYVRTEIKNFLSANAGGENLVDLTGQYLELTEVLTANGLTRNDNWLGLQFIGDLEDPITVPATNTSGKYREIGTIALHVVDRVSATIVDDILTRAETLRDLLRGRRINDIIIESITPPNFESGATLELDGGYQAATLIVSYERDLNL